VTSARRIPQLPETPCIAETLSPGYEAAGWTGLAAPAATPAEIVARISADVRQILAEPAIIERLHGMATLPDPGTPAEFSAFIRAEITKWREVAQAANVRLEG
jgi:tripartite-type tricarboxylate transporter receptor subunit TctC